jgi:hypothetical protein
MEEKDLFFFNYNIPVGTFVVRIWSVILVKEKIETLFKITPELF